MATVQHLTICTLNHDKTFLILKAGYESDIEKVKLIKAETLTEKHGVFILPNEKWARRISGVYGNILAQRNPSRAHAILSEIDGDNYVVSVRASLEHREGADELCRQFKTGGGRKAAAGINKLPSSDYADFIEKFKIQFA